MILVVALERSGRDIQGEHGVRVEIVTIALIALLAHQMERYIYLDVGLVYGLLSFLGVLAVARYLEKGI